MPRDVTLKQWRKLMSKNSPLTEAQKRKMRKERREGKIKIKGAKRKRKKK